jgi:hypothetical protein
MGTPAWFSRSWILRMILICRTTTATGGGKEARGIAALAGLHTLQLFDCDISNRGLTAILERCPNLESLDIRGCFNLKMDTDMTARLGSLKTLRLPSDPTDAYEEKLIDGHFLGCHDHFASYFDDHKVYYDFDY